MKSYGTELQSTSENFGNIREVNLCCVKPQNVQGCYYCTNMSSLTQSSYCTTSSNYYLLCTLFVNLPRILQTDEFLTRMLLIVQLFYIKILSNLHSPPDLGLTQKYSISYIFFQFLIHDVSFHVSYILTRGCGSLLPNTPTLSWFCPLRAF